MAELKDSGTRREFAHSSQKIHSLCDETHTIDEKPTTVCPTCRFFKPKDSTGMCHGEYVCLGWLTRDQMLEGCEAWEPKEEGGK